MSCYFFLMTSNKKGFVLLSFLPNTVTPNKCIHHGRYMVVDVTFPPSVNFQTDGHTDTQRLKHIVILQLWSGGKQTHSYRNMVFLVYLPSICFKLIFLWKKHPYSTQYSMFLKTLEFQLWLYPIFLYICISLFDVLTCRSFGESLVIDFDLLLALSYKIILINSKTKTKTLYHH